jgi:uridine kinase
MVDTSRAVRAILGARDAIPPGQSALVGISGIDGSGKGYVTALLARDLEARGARVANINIDGWLNLPARRFDPARPAEHFYAHAIRFPELFAHLVLPLRARRSLRLVADFAEETATAYRPHTYQFEDVDVILLEGIFLFKRAYRAHFDLALWVECTFDTALERALGRGQEHLPPAETIRAYETIYFAAQRLHLERDRPRAAADLILLNDPRLSGGGPSGGARPPSAADGATGPAPGGA